MRAMEVLPILKEKVAFLSGKIMYMCVCLTTKKKSTKKNLPNPTVWS